MTDTRLEIAYTRWDESCKYPHLDGDWVIRECRRTHGHIGPHASDMPYLEWETVR